MCTLTRSHNRMQVKKELSNAIAQLAQLRIPTDEQEALDTIEQPLLELSHRFAAVERSDMRIFLELSGKGLTGSSLGLQPPNLGLIANDRLQLNKEIIKAGKEFIDKVCLCIWQVLQELKQIRKRFCSDSCNLSLWVV